MPIGKLEQETAAKPQTTIIFLIDTSGSMSGSRIEAVNAAMQEAIPTIQEFADGNPDSSIKYNILEFNTRAQWMDDKPGMVEDFIWSPVQAGGLTALGDAYTKLNEKLTRKSGGFLQPHANNAPILILLSDGEPTDAPELALNKLKENKWFTHAVRIAVRIGEDCDIQELLNFTGSVEGIIPVDDPSKLKELLKILAIRSSLIGSKSQGVKAKSTRDEIIDDLKEGGFDPLRPEDLPEDIDIPDPIDNGDDDDPLGEIFDD